MEYKSSVYYKKQAVNAILAIIVFIISYLLLIISAGVLATACLYFAFLIITYKISYVTLLLGAGVAIFGILIFIFLIKFIFNKHIQDTSHLIEIENHQHPQLFNLIKEVSEEAGTNFPKKVFLTPGVEAYVFYDSSFWSMFLPIRKNLALGMGLINSQTQDELKAIIGHEFGHFSQRAMTVGSYVYNVNKIINNLLYEDDNFKDTSNEIAGVHNFLRIFVFLALKVTSIIKWILSKLFNFLNISNLALSREMEFQADAVSAQIAGSNTIEESLLRIDLASHSFNQVLNFYYDRISQNVKSKNVYIEQTEVLRYIGKKNKMKMNGILPIVTIDEYQKYNKSKLQIKNEWATHPSLKERIESVRKLNIQKQNSSKTAFELLQSGVELQERFTKILLSGFEYTSETVSLEINEFIEQYVKEVTLNDFDELYNEYYDTRNPLASNVEKLTLKDSNATIEELFSDKILSYQYELISMQNDKLLLQDIADKKLKINKFNYDGISYKSKDAGNVIAKIEKSTEEKKKILEENDNNIFVFFYQKAKTRFAEEELLKQYQQFYELDVDFDKKIEIHSEVRNATSFMSVQTPFSIIEKLISNFFEIEKRFKSEIKHLLQSTIYISEINEDTRKIFEEFISKECVYFEENSYKSEDTKLLYNVLNNFIFVLQKKYYNRKKELLDFQIKLIK